ncbi:MAG: hypothetical protein IJI14_16115 [Anaerolineaceae bacterium]|nr:hypothetical protein [Anaerolineaceae bacterium]
MIILVCLLAFIPCFSVHAEDMYDFLGIIKPFVSSDPGFSNITIPMAEKYLNTLSGFTCKRTNFTNRTTRIECVSDKKIYQGSYSLFFSFDNKQRIEFFEIRSAHPALEKLLSKSKFDLDYHSKALWKKLLNMDFITNKEYVTFDTVISSHVFSLPITAINECLKVNDSCVLCLAHKVKETLSDSNMFVLSVSSPGFFVDK